jgi:hypothetical protein
MAKQGIGRTEYADCESTVQRMFDNLRTKLIQDIGLAPSPVAGGVSFKRGGRTVIRIDFKKSMLRIQVGEAFYAAGPATLKGHYEQKDWLVIEPRHQDLGVA